MISSSLPLSRTGHGGPAGERRLLQGRVGQPLQEGVYRHPPLPPGRQQLLRRDSVHVQRGEGSPRQASFIFLLLTLVRSFLFYFLTSLALLSVLCELVSVSGTIFEAKLCTFTLECTHVVFNKCPIYTHDGASAKFSTDSHEMDYSVSLLFRLFQLFHISPFLELNSIVLFIVFFP